MKALMKFLAAPMLALFLASLFFLVPVPLPEVVRVAVCAGAVIAMAWFVMGSFLTGLGRVTGRETGSASLDELNKKLTELAGNATVIQNTADSEHRALTDDERTQLRQLQADFATVEEEISLREANAKMNAKLVEPQARITKPQEPAAPADRAAPRVTGGNAVGAGTYGFNSFGSWALAARKHHHGHPDARIMNAPSSFGSEGVSADGGFAVPPDFKANILKTVFAEESLMSRTDQQQTNGNSLALPKDSVSPWNTSSGVQVAWMGEGAAFTQSKPALSKLETKVHKIGALVSLTDELVEDAGALTGWLNSKVPEKLTSALNDTIVNGDGNGKPLGIMSSGALVTQTKEAGQAAATFVAANAAKMWSRLYAKCRANAVWLINQDLESQFPTMTVGNLPVYLPPGGLSDKPFGTIFGRPVIPVEACKTLGALGDIVLSDLSQYLTVLKSGGLRADTSMHLYFDSGHQAMRFTLRVGGQPYWDAPLARQNGSNTLSCFVTLEAR